MGSSSRIMDLSRQQFGRSVFVTGFNQFMNLVGKRSNVSDANNPIADILFNRRSREADLNRTVIEPGQPDRSLRIPLHTNRRLLFCFLPCFF